MVLALPLVQEVALIVARRGHHCAALQRYSTQELRRRARIAQTHAPGAALHLPAHQHVAAAIDHGVVDAMLLQHAHARFQDGQLGNPTQIQRHAAAPQKRGASVGVQHQILRTHQAQLPRDFFCLRHLLHTLAKVPGLQPAHRHVECPIGHCMDALRLAQHRHHGRRHRHRVLACRCAHAADGALGVVFAQQRLQLTHACKGVLGGAAQLLGIGPLNHDVHGRPHHRPLCTQHGSGCLGRGSPQCAAQQRYGERHTPAAQQVGRSGGRCLRHSASVRSTGRP